MTITLGSTAAAWTMLVGAIGAEVAATLGLRLSDGFSRPLPTIVMAVGYPVSFVLLSRTVRALPLGVVYAVWAAAGTAAIAIIGVLALGESVGIAKIVGILLVIAGVVALNLAGGGHAEQRSSPRPATEPTTRTVALPAPSAGEQPAPVAVRAVTPVTDRRPGPAERVPCGV